MLAPSTTSGSVTGAAITKLVATLSAPLDELPAVARKLRDDLAEAGKREKDLTERALEGEARRILADLRGDGTYAAMFYAITGMFMVLMIAGLLFTVVAAFRYIGGRSGDQEILVSHAIYWYAMSAIYAAIWFLVYVTK